MTKTTACFRSEAQLKSGLPDIWVSSAHHSPHISLNDRQLYGETRRIARRNPNFARGLSPMSPQLQNNVFITYSNPEEFKSKRNRRTVSSVASKNCRPTSRRIVLGRTLYRPFLHRGEEQSSPQSEGTDENESSSSQNDTEQALARVMQSTFLKGSPLGSPLVDPFESYPIHIRPYVPFLVDYCKSFNLQAFQCALRRSPSNSVRNESIQCIYLPC